MSHVTVSGVWARRDKVSHVTLLCFALLCFALLNSSEAHFCFANFARLRLGELAGSLAEEPGRGGFLEEPGAGITHAQPPDFRKK